MSLAEQWNALETGLDPRWSEAQLKLTIASDAHVGRALALLGPAGPGRSGREIRFSTQRVGSAVGPEAVGRMLRRIDDEGIAGALVLVSAGHAAPKPAPAGSPRATLAGAWDALVELLPADWSDLLCEIELTSSDHIDHGALLLGPVNPYQTESDRPGFQFRVARLQGYGASAGMVRRCLSRLDDAGIPGEVRLLRALSDTHPVGTQGPSWMIGGKIV
jgi:hypothetical protein